MDTDLGSIEAFSTAVNELAVCDAGIFATLMDRGYGHQHVYSEHEQKGQVIRQGLERWIELAPLGFSQ